MKFTPVFLDVVGSLRRIACLPAVCLFLAATLVSAADVSDPAATIVKLIEQIGGDEEDVREDAAMELLDMGIAVLPALDAAAGNDNTVQRRRAAQLAQAIRFGIDSKWKAEHILLCRHFEALDGDAQRDGLRRLAAWGFGRTIPFLVHVEREHPSDRTGDTASIEMRHMISQDREDANTVLKKMGPPKTTRQRRLVYTAYRKIDKIFEALDALSGAGRDEISKEEVAQALFDGAVRLLERGKAGALKPLIDKYGHFVPAYDTRLTYLKAEASAAMSSTAARSETTTFREKALNAEADAPQRMRAAGLLERIDRDTLVLKEWLKIVEDDKAGIEYRLTARFRAARVRARLKEPAIAAKLLVKASKEYEAARASGENLDLVGADLASLSKVIEKLKKHGGGDRRIVRVPQITVGHRFGPDATLPISIEVAPFVIGSCPAASPYGPRSFNPGHELWDFDERDEAHWGFGSLYLGPGVPVNNFFGAFSGWPDEREHVLIGYAKALGGNVSIGTQELDETWQKVIVPFHGANIPGTYQGTGAILADDWIVGDLHTTLRYTATGKRVREIELSMVSDAKNGQYLTPIRHDIVTDGKTVEFTQDRLETTQRYIFIVHRRGGGIDIIRRPQHLDSLLRASLPLAEALTARVRTSAQWNILYPDESKDAVIEITSVADRNIDAKVTMTLVDIWDKIMDTQTFDVHLEPTGRFKKDYVVPEGLLGYFTVRFEIDAGAAGKVGKESVVCIVPRRRKGFIPPDDAYFSVYNWHVMNDIFARVGVGLHGMEVTGSYKMPDVAEAYDKLVYSKARALGINVMIRPWRDENNTTKPPKDWAKFGWFVHGIVEYFSERGATHFDSWNEPQFWLSGSKAQVAQMMKHTYINVKRANPDAIVIGPGMLGNLSYNRQVLRAVKRLAIREDLEDMYPFFDYWNIHYGPFPFETDYIRYIRAHRKLLKEFGIDENIPIWNTEQTIPSGAMSNPETHNPKDYWKNAAKYWLRQCYVGASEGVRWNGMFMFGALCRGTGSISTSYLSTGNWYPTPMYATTAIACQQVDTTKFEKRLDMKDDNIWALQFRRKDKGRMLILWTFEDTTTSPWSNRVMTIKVPVDSEHPILVGPMGNQTTLDAIDGTVEVTIDGWPKYLRDPGLK